MRHFAQWIKKTPFLCNEDGAVTVDWVVLTAAIVGLGVVVMYPIATATTDQATGIGNYVSNVTVGFGNQ